MRYYAVKFLHFDTTVYYLCSYSNNDYNNAMIEEF